MAKRHLLVVGVDLNLEKKLANDRYRRKEIPDTHLMLKNVIDAHNLTPIDQKCKRFRSNQPPILPDIFLSNVPRKISSVETFHKLILQSSYLEEIMKKRISLSTNIIDFLNSVKRICVKKRILHI